MKYRFLIGIALLLAAAAALGIYLTWLNPPPIVNVLGYIGGSKAGLLEDADVLRILRERYQLQVAYKTLGGLEQVCDVTPPYDFLWPGTEVSVEEYKECYGGKAKYDSVLLSPVVLYSWEPVTDGLAKAGYIEKKADGVYYADMTEWVTILVEGKTPLPGGTWQDSIYAFTSDPTQSNSGQVFAALLAKQLQKKRGISFQQTLPFVKAYFKVFAPPKTSDLFKQCLGKGVGACPIFVGYESLLPDFVNQNNLTCEQLKSLQAIYPVPTIWASHPLIAETTGGETLLTALLDPAIQKIAVEKHGFRSVLGGTAPHNCIRTAASINAMPLPTKKEMDELQNYLSAK